MALMYLSGRPAASLAQELEVSKATVGRMVWAALQDAAGYHGLELPDSLRAIEGQWFRLVASLPEAG